MSDTDNLAHDGSPVPFRPHEVVELGMDMMKGFSRVEDLIGQLGSQTAERFDTVNQRFDGVDQRLVEIDGDLAHIKGTLSDHGEQLNRYFFSLNVLQTKQIQTQGDLDHVKRDVGLVKHDVAALKEGQASQLAILEEIRGKLN